MLKGVIFAIIACLVWGLVFVVPSFMQEFSSVEVSMGRYFTYGILSLILIVAKERAFLSRLSWKIVFIAMLFGLVSNILYYMGILIGLRSASPHITVLITGMCPILVALYGNWHAKEIRLVRLIIPFALMGGGLVLVNGFEVDWSFDTGYPFEYFLGVLAVVAAVALWSWYAVQNARFLKEHPEIDGGTWSTAIGVATLIWVVALWCFIATDTPALISSMPFWLGATTLGVLSSWVGYLFWNKGSRRLPYTLMGPLLLFETFFSLIFVFMVERRLPTLFEGLGTGLMFGGLLLSLYQFRKVQA